MVGCTIPTGRDLVQVPTHQVTDSERPCHTDLMALTDSLTARVAAHMPTSEAGSPVVFQRVHTNFQPADRLDLDDLGDQLLYIDMSADIPDVLYSLNEESVAEVAICTVMNRLTDVIDDAIDRSPCLTEGVDGVVLSMDYYLMFTTGLALMGERQSSMYRNVVVGASRSAFEAIRARDPSLESLESNGEIEIRVFTPYRSSGVDEKWHDVDMDWSRVDDDEFWAEWWESRGAE